MTTIEIKDASGKKAGSADLAATVFGIEPNTDRHAHGRSLAARLAPGHEQHAHPRPGARRRQEAVAPEGHRPCPPGHHPRPQWAGGGTVFGPHPRSYAFRVNNKEVKLAMRSALSATRAAAEREVVKDIEVAKPSTKAAAAPLKPLGLEGRVALVIADDAVNTYLSFRNIPKVNIIPVSDINTYELIDNKKLVVTADALKYIEEVLA